MKIAVLYSHQQARRTKPKREKANRFEAKYDFTPLIDEAVANKETMVLQTVEVVAEEEKFEELF